MLKFILANKVLKLPIKFHLSLHSSDPLVRAKLMPAAAGIDESIQLIEEYSRETNNPVEVHYSLMDKVNDFEDDVLRLVYLLGGKNISVKILYHSEKEFSDLKKSGRVALFRKLLEERGVETEFYDPPGRDIGSSCGQFLMTYYKEHNQKR